MGRGRLLRRFGVSERAVTQLLGLIIAGAVFITILGAVVVVTVEETAPGSKVDASAAELEAGTLVDLLIGSTGEGWFASAGSRCVGSAENRDAMVPELVTRLGLASEPCASPIRQVPGNLSYDKLVNLQNAAREADPSNGYLDYEEARLALGLDGADRDFHIRTGPVLPTLKTVVSDSSLLDPILRPVYVGDYEPPVGGEVPPLLIEAGVHDGATAITIWVRIENLGTLSTLFEIDLLLPLADRDVGIQRHTPPIPPLSSYNATITVHKSADWSWDKPQIDWSVIDPLQEVASGVIDLSGIDMTTALTQRLFNLHTGDLQYSLNNGNPRVFYEAYDGRGNKVQSHSDWKLDITNPLGLLVASDTSLHSRGWESFSFVEPLTYTVTLKTLLGTALAQERLVVGTVLLGGASPLGNTDWAPKDSALIETAYLNALVQNFDRHVFSADFDHPDLPYAAGGDVYPDVKEVMNRDLIGKLIDNQGTPNPTDDVPTLSRYNMIVIGSHVDHNTLVSERAKGAIAAWERAGGTLIILGSHEQNINWLKTTFESRITSASGGISIPDQSHPILDAPNGLDYTAYTAHGLAWSFASADYPYFTHVVQQGDADLLALSNHGAFGQGRVLVTSYQVFDLLPGGEGPDCDPEDLGPLCDGLQLLHNLITQAYAGLFVDYGPMLPQDRAVGSSVRLAAVWHPHLDHVATRVTVYIF